MLVASICILATAASSSLSVNASRTTDGNNLDHHIPRNHQHSNQHHQHHHNQRPLTDKSHNSKNMQVLASERFSRSSDSFLNNRHEQQQLQQQQRLKQLLQRERLKNLIARTSSVLQTSNNQHHEHRHSRQHSLTSQLFARQQRHIPSSINKKKSHSLSPVQHPMASDPSVVPLKGEARQRDYENGDVLDDHIHVHSDLDDFSLDDDDLMIDDGDSLDVDFDDDGGEFDADVEDDGDDEDEAEAEEDADEDREDRDEDLVEIEADLNIGESLQLAENPTAYERHFNLHMRSQAPKTMKNLHLINHPRQNEVTNHLKKSLRRKAWEHGIEVKETTTATPALQKGMIHQQHRLSKPETVQVPYQSPIVVSISDNSFVSASPIVTSDSTDDNSIGSSNIMENITTITTATTTSNDSFDRVMNRESSVHLGRSTEFPSKRGFHLSRTQIFESITDHNLEPTNDILVGDDKSSKIDRVHNEKSESSHDSRNLLLGNGGNSAKEAYVTDGKMVDSLDRATTMQTNINYSVLGDEEDNDDVDLNVSDMDRVKLDADDLPQSKATTIRYSHIIASPRNELPSYGRKYWHDSHIASIQMVQEVSLNLQPT